MKILNISLDKKLFETGSGVEERVLEYGKIFDRFDILVLCGFGYEKKEFDKIAIWPTNSKNKFFYLLDALRLGKKMIEQYKYDLISVQEPFEVGLIGWWLARKYGFKLQVQLHGDFFGSLYFRQESFLNWFRYCLGKFIIRRANGIRVVSKRIKKSLLEMGIKEEKISVVPIYVVIPAPHVIPAKAGIYGVNSGGNPDFSNVMDSVSEHGMTSDDKFIFLTVGRLVPVKNIEMQIEAMAEVAKKYPEAELWIVGDGPLKKRLEDSVTRLDLRAEVKFLGWQSDLEEFYSRADVFLLTSNYEGWGLAIVEAASFGLPVIMTDVGCAGEVIIDGESGIVVPVGDSKKLAENMLKLISDENLRKRLSEGARQAVLRLPNKEQSLEMYKNACETSRA